MPGVSVFGDFVVDNGYAPAVDTPRSRSWPVPRTPTPTSLSISACRCACEGEDVDDDVADPLARPGTGAYLVLFLSVVWGLVGTTSVVRQARLQGHRHQHPPLPRTIAMLPSAGGPSRRVAPRPVPTVRRPRSRLAAPRHVPSCVRGVRHRRDVSLVRRRPAHHLGEATTSGTTWWRRFHLAAVPAFTVAMVHGVWTGTDSVQPLVWWIYMVTGSFVLFLVLVRGLTARERPASGPPRERTIPVVPPMSINCSSTSPARSPRRSDRPPGGVRLTSDERLRAAGRAPGRPSFCAPDIRVVPRVDGDVVDDREAPIVQTHHLRQQLGADAVPRAGDRIDAQVDGPFMRPARRRGAAGSSARGAPAPTPLRNACVRIGLEGLQRAPHEPYGAVRIPAGAPTFDVSRPTTESGDHVAVHPAARSLRSRRRPRPARSRTVRIALPSGPRASA